MRFIVKEPFHLTNTADHFWNKLFFDFLTCKYSTEDSSNFNYIQKQKIGVKPRLQLHLETESIILFFLKFPLPDQPHVDCKIQSAIQRETPPTMNIWGKNNSIKYISIVSPRDGSWSTLPDPAKKIFLTSGLVG